MPYRDFYHLKDFPFSNAPMASLYFSSPVHERALMKLRHAADNMLGLAICSGEIGAGKTMVSRRLLASLPKERFESALLVIVHAGVTADWLMKRIALQLGVEKPSSDKLSLLSQLYRRLLALYKAGKKVVVLIDEAQMLNSREIMEEFRGMLNLEIPSHKLITFVLFGLPELDQVLQIDEPLRQRVAVRCRLVPLDAEATAAYVQYRFGRCGGDKSVFSADALGAIHKYADGTPRLINTICDNALLEGVIQKSRTIGVDIIDNVAEELGLFDSDIAIDFDEETVTEFQENTPENSGDDLDELDALLKELDHY